MFKFYLKPTQHQHTNTRFCDFLNSDTAPECMKRVGPESCECQVSDMDITYFEVFGLYRDKLL